MSIPSVRSYLALIVSRLPPKRTLPSFRPIEKHLPQHLNSSFTSNLNPPSDALVCHATRLVLCASSDSLKDDTIPWLQSISSLEVLPEVLPPASSTLPPPFIREIICHYHPNPPPVSPLSSLLSSIFPPPPPPRSPQPSEVVWSKIKEGEVWREKERSDSKSRRGLSLSHS